jgi:hypothetical protein
MTSVFTSYKKTPGFKMFGKDWEPIHELNLYWSELQYDERQLIKKLVHIGHKLSKPLHDSDEKDAYMFILKDIHRRIAEVTKEKEDLEDLIGSSFDELLQRKQFTPTS